MRAVEGIDEKVLAPATGLSPCDAASSAMTGTAGTIRAKAPTTIRSASRSASVTGERSGFDSTGSAGSEMLHLHPPRLEYGGKQTTGQFVGGE